MMQTSYDTFRRFTTLWIAKATGSQKIMQKPIDLGVLLTSTEISRRTQSINPIQLQLLSENESNYKAWKFVI